MKNKLRLLLGPLTIMSILLIAIISGCSSSKTLNITPQDKNSTTIKTVLEKQFTGPNLKLIEMLSSEKNLTVIGKDGKVKQPKSPTELEKYYEKNYQPYFTENMYNHFIAAYASNYQFLAHKSGYKIKVDDIDIKEDGTTKGAYEFLVKVSYEKEGTEQKYAVVSGRVNFNKDGKITRIIYTDDGGLTNAMNN